MPSSQPSPLQLVSAFLAPIHDSRYGGQPACELIAPGCRFQCNESNLVGVQAIAERFTAYLATYPRRSCRIFVQYDGNVLAAEIERAKPNEMPSRSVCVHQYQTRVIDGKRLITDIVHVWVPVNTPVEHARVKATLTNGLYTQTA